MIEEGQPVRIRVDNSNILTFHNKDGTLDCGLIATPAAHTHEPADVTGTAVIDNDARLTNDRTPTAHTDSVHSGASANLLTALSPTFINWTTNPGTNADLTSELSNSALTTAGVSRSTSGGSIIFYNLGSSRRRIFDISSFQAGFYILFSDDGITYYTDNTGTELIYVRAMKFRYIKFLAVSVITFEGIHMKCYNLN